MNWMKILDISRKQKPETANAVGKARVILADMVSPPRSQSDVARSLRVTPQAVQKWVKQGYVPTGRALQIESLYGIPAIDIVSPQQRELLLSIANQ